MKLLIIRFSSLGDIILTTPCLALLKENLPQAEIFFATKLQFAGIFKENPNITEVLSLQPEEKLGSFIKRIKSKGRFDIVIDLHHSLRSRLVRTLIPKERLFVYRKPYFKRWLLVVWKINLLPQNEQVSFRYMKPLKPLGIVPKLIQPLVYHETSSRIEKVISLAKSKNLIAIAPGARWYTKTWPLENFLEVAQTLLKEPKHILVFLGGEEEKNLNQRIEESLSLQLHKRVFNFIGGLSLAETFHIISHARLLLCNDSGLMHAASAFNTRVLPLFLSTVPEFGFIPLGLTPNDVISHSLKCKPCDHKGLSRCPKKHFQCAKLIRPEEVSRRVLGLLESRWSSY